ncbi:MAG: cell wall-binding repeat-containing protein [Eggerthellaceae bacterium]|nr:cell wall-binding repeat-containing protein [Eggerthellaceae bacterium]
MTGTLTHLRSLPVLATILATSKPFQDALSAAPVAYAQRIPVFLVSGSSVDANTLSAMKQCGVKRVVVLGGTLAIPDSVVSQLQRAGMTTVRIWGSGVHETSHVVVDWDVTLGMSSNKTGVATPTIYYDALCARRCAAGTTRCSRSPTTRATPTPPSPRCARQRSRRAALGGGIS